MFKFIKFLVILIFVLPITVKAVSQIDNCIISPNVSHYACIMINNNSSNGKYYVVSDEYGSGLNYTKINNFKYSANSARLVYVGFDNKNTYSIVNNGSVNIISNEKIDYLTFSDDAKKFGYATNNNRGNIVIINNKEQAKAYALPINNLQFSSNSKDYFVGLDNFPNCKYAINGKEYEVKDGCEKMYISSDFKNKVFIGTKDINNSRYSWIKINDDIFTVEDLNKNGLLKSVTNSASANFYFIGFSSDSKTIKYGLESEMDISGVEILYDLKTKKYKISVVLPSANTSSDFSKNFSSWHDSRTQFDYLVINGVKQKKGYLAIDFSDFSASLKNYVVSAIAVNGDDVFIINGNDYKKEEGEVITKAFSVNARKFSYLLKTKDNILKLKIINF